MNALCLKDQLHFPNLVHLENKNGEQMDTITGVSCFPEVSPEKRHLSVLSVISISPTVLRLANTLNIQSKSD